MTMDAFARWLVRRPLVAVSANLAVTLVLGFYAIHIRVESSLASVLPKGDPASDYYAKVRKTFGGDNVAVVGVRTGDLFSQSTLEKIAAVTDALGKIDGVETVLSITNAPDPAADIIDPPPLLPAT